MSTSSSSEGFRKSPASRLGRWLLFLLIPASALALGTVHRLPLLIVSVVAAALVALIWSNPVGKLPREARWVVYGALVLIGFTALQAIPLPDGLVRALAPLNADIWERALAPFGEGPLRVHPISVAPTMTYTQLLRGLVYLAIYLATLRLVASDQSVLVERAILVSTTLMALLALAHPAVGAEKVLGVYRPRYPSAFSEHYYAPLLNPNHLAAYLNIGFCIGLASSVSKKPAFPRALLAGMTLLLAGTSIWMASRGGIGGLALAILAIAILTTLASARQRYRGTQLGAAVFIAVAGAILIGVASSEATQHELTDTNIDKLSIAKSSVELALRAPFFGFGRGAFEDVFPRVMTDVRYFTYTNPENIVAQWVAEWGFPISIVTVAIFAWALRPDTVLSSVRPAIGAWTAIVVSVVHDLVDFHLEVPGVMIPIAACAALVTGRRIHSGEGVTLRNKAFAISGAIGVAALLVAIAPGYSLADEREHMTKLATDSSVSADTFRAEEHAAMLRHPSEAYLPLTGAVRAQLHGEGSVLPWAAAALERYPRFGRAHLVLARSLVRRNPSQARLEYRLAYEYDVRLTEEAIAEAARLVDGHGAALELVNDGPTREAVLELLIYHLAKRLPSTAYMLEEELLRVNPSNDAVLARRAEEAVSDEVNAHPWCESEDCVAAALKATQADVAAHPDQCAPHLLYARAVVGGSKDIAARRHALDDLVRSLDDVRDRSQCERSMLQLMQEMGDERYVDTMLKSLLRSGCGSGADCVDLFTWAGEFEERRSRPVTALAYYKHASALAPDREDLLTTILRIATSQDLLGDAVTAADALARRHPDDPNRAAAAASLAGRLRARSLSGVGAVPGTKGL